MTLPRLLVVPRHLQRFDEVQALAQKHGFTVSRRSQWKAGPTESEEAAGTALCVADMAGCDADGVASGQSARHAVGGCISRTKVRCG